MNSRELRVQRLFGLLVTWAVVGAAIGISWNLASNRFQVLILLVLVGVATSLLVWCVRKRDWRALGLDLSIELTGAVVTYLLLELAVGGVEEKARLVAEMGSGVNDVAVMATEKLRQHGLLTDGSLQGAGLRSADLQDADLSLANLQRADLGHADLQGADLGSADLRGANLQWVDLRGADLGGADLQEAGLGSANLQRADLGYANLQGASLGYANLQGADLRGAYLRGVNLRGANLEGADLGGARLNETTSLPDGPKWTPDTDMARFTDPDHPEFWRSDGSKSPGYRGKDGD